MTALVSIAGVTKRYGRIDAVAGVGFELHAGEVVALVGHNGAGKTTLMKLVLGVVRPDSGTTRVFGRDPAGLEGAACRAGLGFLPENVAFHAAMTGRELLDFFARLKRQPVAANDRLLQWVGLAEAGGRRVGTYSKGMRQRLGLAQALIGKPRLLLLDEPTTGLDPESRIDFFATLDQLRADGVAVLISTHALAEIERHADRIAVMHHGRLVACGPLTALGGDEALPLTIRLRAAPCAAARIAAASAGHDAEAVRCGERDLVIRCRRDRGLALLRALAGLDGAVEDIAVERPGLEAVYRHLIGREGAS